VVLPLQTPLRDRLQRYLVIASATRTLNLREQISSIWGF
jgi:hypothetical protein